MLITSASTRAVQCGSTKYMYMSHIIFLEKMIILLWEKKEGREEQKKEKKRKKMKEERKRRIHFLVLSWRKFPFLNANHLKG